MIPIDVEAEFDPETLSLALTHLEKAVSAAPDHLRYRRGLGEALLAARRFQEALVLLDPLISQRHELRLAYLVAYARYRLGDHAGALSILNTQGNDQVVGFTRLHLLRGRIFMSLGRFEDAVNEFVRAQILNPAHRESRWLEAKALILAAGRRSDDTSNLYRRALKLLSGHTPTREEEDEWHLLLGRVYLALRYAMDALHHLERSKVPTLYERQLLTGIAFLMNGRADEAVSWLSTAVGTPEGRRRTESCLMEVALGNFSALRQKTASIPLPPPLLDLAFLSRVFGVQAVESEHILAVARSPKSAVADRTQVDDIGGGMERLFAGTLEDVQDPPETRPSPDYSPSPPDKLHPQTWIEYEPAALDVADTVIDRQADSKSSASEEKRFSSEGGRNSAETNRPLNGEPS